MDDRAISQAVANPRTYVDQPAYDALFAGLRRRSPVHWVDPDGYRPFWLVTRHADIMEIERQNDRFVNEPRLILSTVGDEHRLATAIASKTALRTLVNMDNPDHRLFRAASSSTAWRPWMASATSRATSPTGIRSG